ncbi:MAG TPA: ABC transporter permease [Candidatus Dormibacteraeota bacterium]|nr:ABC transporter permease [Candidatus Dormibacteraeota bacterium]
MDGRGTFAPAPGPAPALRRVMAQAAMELRLQLRNGEQLLLTLAIPILVLVVFSIAPVLGERNRVDFLLPGVIGLAVMSTAFTGQAIATGFDRRYGVLKRLGATPLGRSGLILGKTTAMLGVEAIQVLVLGLVAWGLGWRPHGSVPTALLLILVGTAAFSGLGLLLAGLLRAEATLGAANLVYLILLVVGGVVFPVSDLPSGLQRPAELLPITALTEGLRAALGEGGGLQLRDLAELAAWAILGAGLASATFHWE